MPQDPLLGRYATLGSLASGQPDFGYGNRYNSPVPKGIGFLGPLQRPDGNVMSELSIGVKLGGKETEIPTLVPTLTKAEVQQLLALKEGQSIPQPIVHKAVAHAVGRIQSGQDPFARLGEQQMIHPDLPRQWPELAPSVGSLADLFQKSQP